MEEPDPVPPGEPGSTSAPALPRRRPLGPRLVAILGLFALATVAAAVAGLGTVPAVLAITLAVTPLPFYLALALWVDRFEPEPRSLLAVAFLWGASAAIFVSGIVNTLADTFVGEMFGSLVSAPLVEETSKAFILVVIAVRRRDEFDGVVDGIVYAAMTGLGFAFVENIDYYGRALLRDGPGGLAAVFVLRGIVAAFSHPLFTSMFGIGLGLARQFPQPGLSILAPAAGLSAAVGLHLMWNSGASLGIFFFAVYTLVMLPGLGVVAALVGFFLRDEGRIIRLRQAPEVDSGLLTPADLVCLGSVRGRLHASFAAWSTGGWPSWAARRRYHQAASELAFLRERQARDGTPTEPDQEAVYLDVLRRHRAPDVTPPPPAGTS